MKLYILNGLEPDKIIELGEKISRLTAKLVLLHSHKMGSEECLRYPEVYTTIEVSDAEKFMKNFGKKEIEMRKKLNNLLFELLNFNWAVSDHPSEALDILEEEFPEMVKESANRIERAEYQESIERYNYSLSEKERREEREEDEFNAKKGV